MNRLSKNDKIALTVLTICALELIVFFVFLRVKQIGFWGSHFAGGDDAYITYRTARNIATGQGFGFNPDEPMLVTTAPLYAIMLGVLYFVSSNMPVVAGLLGLLCTWAGSLFVYLILRKAAVHHWPALLGALLYMTSPLLLFLLGMESPVLFAFILGSFWAAMTDRNKTAVVLAALATLIRPDALLVGGIVLLRRVWVSRKIPWKESALYMAVLVPWILFAWLYFGSILPTSFHAKVAQGQAGHWNIFLTDIPAMLRPWIPHWNEIAFGLVGLSLLGLLGYWRRLGPVVAWCVGYTVAYRLLAVPGYYWYYAPYFVVGAMLSGAGVEFGAKLLTYEWGGTSPADGSAEDKKHSRPVQSMVRWGVGLLALVLVGYCMDSTIEIYARDWQFQDGTNSRFRTYHPAGEWLAAHTKEDATVGSFEIGIVGYLSDRYIIDLCGLAQPEADEAIAQGDYLKFFLDRQPDYYVSWQPVERFCYRPDDFRAFRAVLKSRYVPVAMFNAPSGGAPVVIYWRQPEKENP